jgi:hypothetical protein
VRIANEALALAETTTDSAAANYRQETAKAKPDQNELARLDSSLQEQVRKALEAKMKIRELRLQLAALDLQEVQAEHDRRKPMLDEIVKERVQSLIASRGDSSALLEQSVPVVSVTPKSMPADDIEKQGRYQLFTIGMLFPGDPLTEEDIQRVLISAKNPGGKGAFTSIEQVKGLSPRMPLSRAIRLTSKNTMPTPLPDHFSGEMVEKVANGTSDIFAQSNLRFIRASSNCFNPGHSLENWADLPTWTPHFISSANKYLHNVVDGKSSITTVGSILEQLDLLQLVWTSSDDWDFERTGDLLSEFVEEMTSTPDENSDYALRALVLRQIARTTGILPESVYTAEPGDAGTVERLRLLDRMLAANADNTWISQEQIRLAGLLELAPKQTIRRIIQHDESGSRSTIRQWIYALSTVGNFRTDPEDLPPPIDPLLLLTIVESFAGQNKIHDERISFLFGPDGLNRKLLFSYHLNEILTGTLAYRETVLKSLSNMHASAKSEKLREAIAELAPGVVPRKGEDPNESADTPIDELVDD